jgi:hypothetical protein
VTPRTLRGFQFDREHLLPVLMPWMLSAGACSGAAGRVDPLGDDPHRARQR